MDQESKPKNRGIPRIVIAAIAVSLACYLIIALRVILFVGEGLSNIGDTVVTIHFIAFLDENVNGIRDPGEPPLPGVEFSLGSASYQKNETATSDQNGEAKIRELINVGDLKHGLFKASAQVPPGYTNTTPLRYSVTDERSFSFGFIPLPGTDPEP